MEEGQCQSFTKKSMAKCINSSKKSERDSHTPKPLSYFQLIGRKMNGQFLTMITQGSYLTMGDFHLKAISTLTLPKAHQN